MPVSPKDVRIVCGLGNPGAQYQLTRHNAGFATIDVLAERLGVRYWKSEGGCDTATVKIGSGPDAREVILAKPQSYMNTSGGPLSKLARAHKVSPAEISARLGGGYAAESLLRSARAYSGGEVREGVRLLLDTEWKLKSGQLNTDGLAETALLRLLSLKKRG